MWSTGSIHGLVAHVRVTKLVYRITLNHGFDFWGERSHRLDSKIT